MRIGPYLVRSQQLKAGDPARHHAGPAPHHKARNPSPPSRLPPPPQGPSGVLCLRGLVRLRSRLCRRRDTPTRNEVGQGTTIRQKCVLTRASVTENDAIILQASAFSATYVLASTLPCRLCFPFFVRVGMCDSRSRLWHPVTI